MELSTPGQRIRFLRTRRGWSQRDLAKRANTSHVSISYYEKDKYVPGHLTQVLLAEALDTTRDFLFREKAA